ncbi:unnamed protein product [Rotaria sp. Silwood2]|nr:unnamed protein product [Rotaria sp. Silwood2]CAF2801972.1 unnamed protein product [Rotaria sp. Silwood2]CAF3000026.1 unnamed protein product [Rotaria sp. Silwood2]CAF3162884.1 unnamed protein product [Rotaria sp. Silwood2]CAF3880395.1 unnamed protein product [Rotaria sp. Silwood2]
MMYSNLILLAFISLLIPITGKKDDEPDLPAVSYTAGRSSKSAFDAQFPRGRCPERFYQIGEECLYFSIDGKIYSWQNADRICARRIGNILEQQSSSNPDQPNMKPTKGVRQLILNTPEKTEILRAFSQEYNEQNFAIRLPSDYNTLQRCNDAQDYKWPFYCANTQNTNSMCIEDTSNGANDICLREVDCNQRYLRLACEFTLPGSAELTNSQFRHCTKIRGRGRRLPMWAWIAIIIGGTLLLLIIIGVIIALMTKSKKKTSRSKITLPEPRRPDEKGKDNFVYEFSTFSSVLVIRVPPRRADPAAEPMLTRAAPTNESNTDYLQPRSSAAENTSNA